MKKLVAFGVVLVFAGILVYFFSTKNSDENLPGNDNDSEQVFDATEPSLDYSTTLVDVTDGESIRGVTTSGSASGEAIAGLDSGRYSLVASFSGLPDPDDSDFYEGWVMRQEPPSIVSTGRVEKNGDQFFNIFSSDENLLDHSLYVLTLETDDNDPSPNDYILEGKFVNLYK
ncbi:MAG: hypothetical protein A2831_02320 [Candidatus Yanofskybacteria bacterium RIFCSPHIGHO2_01_FULL_44_17]|uniref:Uncharacterized protein n=1 Tax=Candidatus Yanofskybacteria bacterium RIFCSPHIGHO2_01_FULL_44_17 TaxID=1802668 RepID=A0A1F8EV72_9BACT|nr:MAG: hypothetical protein A2831_02320 [Candidatus Yanofskybacteria bacterium RIFCSPHIGHO2_01_FULL_44_17]